MKVYQHRNVLMLTFLHNKFITFGLLLYNGMIFFFINHFSLIISYHSVLVGLWNKWFSSGVGAHIKYSSRSCVEDMTITNVIIKPPNRKWAWVWMTSCLEAMGWEFGDFWKKKLVEIWVWAGPVQLGWGLTVGDVGTVSIVKIVSLSLCRKTKRQEVNKSFVPEQRRVVSVWVFPVYVTLFCFSIFFILSDLFP